MRNYVECLAKDLLPGDTFSLDRRPSSKLFVIYSQTEVRKPIIVLPANPCALNQKKTLLILIEWPKCGQLKVFADRKVYRLDAHPEE